MSDAGAVYVISVFVEGFENFKMWMLIFSIYAC